MRRWLRLAAKLYPRVWRDRYAQEFTCVLDDVKPRWSDVVDVLRGAVTMQVKMWSRYLKLVAAVAVAGAVVALVVSFLMPGWYVAAATVSAGAKDPQTFDRIQHAWQQVVSRASLSEIIQRPSLDLYKSDRNRKPLEDVIEDMKMRGIRIDLSGGEETSVRLSFTYPDRYKAQAVANALMRKFIDAARVSSSVTLANLPEVPVTPNRIAYAAWGLAIGLGIGVVASCLRWRAKFTMKIAGFGLAGCAVAGGLSLLLPNQYVSRAMFRVLPPPNADGGRRFMTEAEMADWMKKKEAEILSDASLAEIIQRPAINLYSAERKSQPLEKAIAMMRKDLKIEILPFSHSAFTISFRYADRYQAQQVVAALVTKFSDSEFMTTEADLMAAPNPARRTSEGCFGTTGDEYVDCITPYFGHVSPLADSVPRRRKSAESLDLLDPASLPETPTAPNRFQVAMMGMVMGLLLGAFALRRRPAPSPPRPAIPPSPSTSY